MARIIEELPPRTTSRQSKYPWDEWFDGKPRELVAGEDFKGDPDNFRRTIYSAASVRKIKVTTRLMGKNLGLQAELNGKPAKAETPKNGK